MPASRPKRKRIRTVIIIILGRTVQKLNNNEDGTVFECLDIELGKVAEMYEDFNEMDVGFNSNVDAAFEALADYVEENDPLNEETLESLLSDIQNAWT